MTQWVKELAAKPDDLRSILFTYCLTTTCMCGTTHTHGGGGDLGEKKVCDKLKSTSNFNPKDLNCCLHPFSMQV